MVRLAFQEGSTELALDFLREQVVIGKYVYTCTVRQEGQCLGEDDSEMGSAGDFACQTNHYQPSLLHR